MEIKDLQYFLAIIEAGSFSQAALDLHITQPTLSRCIQNLENELHTALLKRNRKGIELTASGRNLKRRAEELVLIHQKTLEEFSSQKDEISGTISISFGLTKASWKMIEIISSFSKKYPKVKFTVKAGDTLSILSDLESGICDIGVVIGDENLDHYEKIELKEKEEWGFFVNRKNPLSQLENLKPSDVKEYPIIMSARPYYEQILFKWMKPYKPNIRIHSPLHPISEAFIIDEAGIAFTTIPWDKKTLSPNTKFIPTTPELFLASYYIWKKSTRFSQAIQTFIDFMLSQNIYTENVYKS